MAVRAADSKEPMPATTPKMPNSRFSAVVSHPTPISHTPRPWKAKQDGQSFYHEVFDATSIRVCNLLDPRPVHENQANARLIAAAPETAAERDRLREALQALLSWVEAETDGRDWPHPILNQARAALGLP